MPEDPPRRRGRPPVDPDNGSCKLTVTISAKDFDRLYAQARDARLTMPEWIRRELRRGRTIRRSGKV